MLTVICMSRSTEQFRIVYLRVDPKAKKCRFPANDRGEAAWHGLSGGRNVWIVGDKSSTFYSWKAEKFLFSLKLY